MDAVALGHSENNVLLLCYKYQHGKTLESSGSLSFSLSLGGDGEQHHNERMATGSQVIAPSTDKHGHKLSSLEPCLNNGDGHGLKCVRMKGKCLGILQQLTGERSPPPTPSLSCCCLGCVVGTQCGNVSHLRLIR